MREPPEASEILEPGKSASRRVWSVSSNEERSPGREMGY